MHRTLSVPRLIGCLGLVCALALQVGINSAAAQPQPQPKSVADTPVVIMAVGTSQIFQTTSKEKLSKAASPNPKVLQLRRVQDDPTAVLVEALMPGRVRISLTDDKGVTETIEIIVLSDKVKDLRELIARTVPTASVNVNANESNTLVVLNGYVLTAEDARAVRLAAKNLFGDNVIDNLRIGGVQQVQLEVIVAVVDRSRIRNMSFSWAANGNEWFASSFFGSPFSFANGVATGVFNSLAPVTGSNLTSTGVYNIPFGVIHNNNNFLSYLQLLTTESLAKIMAEPRVMTLSGKPANIVSGGSTPILTSSGLGAPSVAYQNFGTVVSCLPTVLGNGKILLEVKPEVSSIDPANGISVGGTTPTVIPGFDVRSAQVTIMIEDGQTLAIGGLIQNKVTASIIKVPVLGDLPFLSAFFQSKTYNETEEEMIILVTPRLVAPIDCTKIPHYLPSRETRGPDDFEFFLEGILEAPRKPRTVVFHPQLYQGAFKNAPNAGEIPCANGNCNGGMGVAGCSNCGQVRPAAYVAPAAPNATQPAPMAIPKAAPTTTPAPAPAPAPAKTVSAPTIPSASAPTPPSAATRVAIEVEAPTIPINPTPPSASPPSLPAIPTPEPVREIREIPARPVLPPSIPN